MKTKIMGIVNVTPDSFYECSRSRSLGAAVARALEMAHIEGADIIDIGGESTRPYSDPVPEKEEMGRIIPVIRELIRQKCSVPISVDTIKPNVAKQALDAGATFINDVSGFRDPEMRLVAKESGCYACVVHMLGDPKTMQDSPCYEGGVVKDVFEWLEMQAKVLLHEGIDQEKIILDPGIGFGKTVTDNLQLLAHIDTLQELGFKTLVGVSRKSFMSKLLGRDTRDLMAATLAVNVMLMQKKIDYIRVHDVKLHHDARNMVQAMYST